MDIGDCEIRVSSLVKAHRCEDQKVDIAKYLAGIKQNNKLENELFPGEKDDLNMFKKSLKIFDSSQIV